MSNDLRKFGLEYDPTIDIRTFAVQQVSTLIAHGYLVGVNTPDDIVSAAKTLEQYIKGEPKAE